MVRTSEKGLQFMYSKISFKDNGHYVELYTDTPSAYDSYRNMTNITEFTSGAFVPSEDEIKRLEELNKITDLNAGFVHDITEFLKHGYIAHTAPDFLKPLASKYEASSKAYLMDKVRKEAKKCRVLKQDSGIMFNGAFIETAKADVLSLNSIYTTFKDGLVETVNFKTKDTFIRVDKETVIAIYKAVTKHVDKCFDAEGITISKLESMSVEDIAKALEPKHEVSGPASSPEDERARKARAKVLTVEEIYLKEYNKLMGIAETPKPKPEVQPTPSVPNTPQTEPETPSENTSTEQPAPKAKKSK